MFGGVVGFVLIAAALIAALAARRIESGGRRHRSETPGPEWAALRERIDAGHPLLHELTITRFGYDRQVHRAGSMLHRGRERVLVQYSFASGFGENRQLFQCLILACPIDGSHDVHTVITADDRIAAAAAAAPAWRCLRQENRWWITNDPDAIPSRGRKIAAWLRSQPADRNVECHPGVVALYQSGTLTTEAAQGLNVAADELIAIVADGVTKD